MAANNDEKEPGSNFIKSLGEQNPGKLAALFAAGLFFIGKAAPEFTPSLDPISGQASGLLAKVFKWVTIGGAGFTAAKLFLFKQKPGGGAESGMHAGFPVPGERHSFIAPGIYASVVPQLTPDAEGGSPAEGPVAPLPGAKNQTPETGTSQSLFSTGH